MIQQNCNSTTDINVQSEVQQPTGDKCAPHRILVVEDCTSSGLVMSHFLKSMNFDARTVQSGEQALQLAASNRFDVIFMDVSLPGIDGYQTMERLKTEVGHKDAKFVIFTGYSIEVEPNDLSALLAKPFTRSSLAQCLQSVLGYSYYHAAEVWKKRHGIRPNFISAHA